MSILRPIGFFRSFWFVFLDKTGRREKKRFMVLWDFGGGEGKQTSTRFLHIRVRLFFCFIFKARNDSPPTKKNVCSSCSRSSLIRLQGRVRCKRSIYLISRRSSWVALPPPPPPRCHGFFGNSNSPLLSWLLWKPQQYRVEWRFD